MGPLMWHLWQIMHTSSKFWDKTKLPTLPSMFLSIWQQELQIIKYTTQSHISACSIQQHTSLLYTTAWEEPNVSHWLNVFNCSYLGYILHIRFVCKLNIHHHAKFHMKLQRFITYCHQAKSYIQIFSAIMLFTLTKFKYRFHMPRVLGWCENVMYFTQQSIESSHILTPHPVKKYWLTV